MFDPSARPPATYSTEVIDATERESVHRRLALRSDLALEQVHVSQSRGSAVDPAFCLVPHDFELELPPTPFADVSWSPSVSHALARGLVLVMAKPFLRAADSGRLHELHAALYQAQRFHRACAALHHHRGQKPVSLALSGLVVSLPLSERFDHTLNLQLTHLWLRIEAFDTSGRSRAHFAVASSPVPSMPTVLSADLQAIAHRPRTVQRDHAAERVIEAFAPFRIPCPFGRS